MQIEGCYEESHLLLRTRIALAMTAVLLVTLLLAPGSAEAAHSSTVAGADRFATAAAQAAQAYPRGCAAVIVVESDAWPDALSAAGLAGALDCPILFTGKDAVPAATAGAISSLGASEVVLIGDERRVSERGEAALGSTGAVKSVRRVCGRDRYETQQAVYDFGRGGYDGVDRWGRGLAVLASGASFPDALSASPLAASEAAPIFLVDPANPLPASQQEALLEGGFSRIVVLGDEGAVSERVLGYARGLTALASPTSTPDAVRLGGADRYETSAALARWCVQEGYLSWDGAAFTSGTRPYDAMAGGVLQAKRGAVMLLADHAFSNTIAEFSRHGGAISRYAFFGSSASIGDNLRTYIAYSLQFGHALPMGGTRLSDGSYIWCDWTGVWREDNVYYRGYLDRANWYGSVTGWLILVDTSANRTLIFNRGNGTWVVNKDYSCTTGALWTPTVKGVFEVGLRGMSFGSGYTCWYWTQFYGDYLFHSVLYWPGSMTSIQDGRLGINASHGCVRLDIGNAKWIYDNIPSHTKVVVF